MSTNSSPKIDAELGKQNTLALSDALSLVARVPSGMVELCYIDPPLFPKVEWSGIEDRSRFMREHLLGVAEVLQQARRCLAPKGNIFVHSEPEMNGSIRLLLDQVFGRDRFRQEIVVPRLGHGNRGRLSSGHDTVFHFSLGDDFVFNPQTRELTSQEVANQFSESDERGPYRIVSLVSPIARTAMAFEWEGAQPPPGKSWKYSRERLEQLLSEGRIVFRSGGNAPGLKQYASEKAGTDVGSVWDDMLRVTRAERTHYPTQKPTRLVERIIKMGSTEGALLLDPYCGSGTTLVAATRCGRRWIAGDNCADAIAVATRRLEQECRLTLGKDFVSTTEDALRTKGGPHSLPSLSISTGFDDLRTAPIARLIFGRPLEIEETREYEFKEVTSNRPLDAITNTADEYAVAFLNSQGGKIFWGVRNSDRVVVGVKLTYEDRDRLRQIVTNKLGAIRPAIDPTAYRLELHHVEHPQGATDFVVIELVVPRVRVSMPYFTGGNDAFVRLDGIKRKLAGPELTEWIVRRMSGL